MNLTTERATDAPATPSATSLPALDHERLDCHRVALEFAAMVPALAHSARPSPFLLDRPGVGYGMRRGDRTASRQRSGDVRRCDKSEAQGGSRHSDARRSTQGVTAAARFWRDAPLLPAAPPTKERRPHSVQAGASTSEAAERTQTYTRVRERGRVRVRGVGFGIGDSRADSRPGGRSHRMEAAAGLASRQTGCFRTIAARG